MLFSGNQLRAARSLVGMEQSVLAEKSGVSVNTIRNMEAAGAQPIEARTQSLRAVQAALEQAGVLFIPTNGGGVGVRLAKPSATDADAANRTALKAHAAASRTLDEVKDQSASPDEQDRRKQKLLKGQSRGKPKTK